MMENIWSFILRNWHKPKACILLNLISIFSLASFFYNFDLANILRINESIAPNRITLFEFVILVVISLSINLFWWLSSSVPKNKKGKIGIIIAICTEVEDEKMRLKNDFIRHFQEKINEGNRQDVFNIMEYPEHYAVQVSKTSQNNYLNKSKAHFIVYGLLRKRKLKDVEKYFFELEFAVRHAPVPQDISRKFAAEMGDIAPRRVQFDVGDEFNGFSVTTDWAVFATEYVIGVAAALTGDLVYAVNIQKKLFYELLKISSDLPAIKLLKGKNRKVLLASWYELLRVKYYSYRKTGDIKLLEEILVNVKELLEIEQLDARGNILLAIILFLKDRDVEGGFERLRIMKKTDNTWRYSEAFLYAYRGDLERAIRSYRKALREYAQPHVPEESEEFIHDILKIEPQKYQLWFCLGFINYQCKCDMRLAQEDFNKFIELGNQDEFREQKRLARIYLGEIKTKLSKEKP